MRWVLVLVVACGSPAAMPDAAPPGTLDESFGIGGVVQVAGGTATDVALVGSDLVVFGAGGGDLVVTRLSASGVLDGVVADTHVAGPLGTPDGGMATLPDGHLALPAFDRLIRATPDGVVDATFGSAGIVAVPSHEAWHTVLAVGDRLVICGTFDRGSPQPLARRLDAAGAVDATFGSGGLAVAAAGLGTIFNCRAQADGALVLVGRQSNAAIVGRMSADGALDATFGSGGFEVVTAAADARALVIGADGDYLVAGAIAGDFGVARLTPSGAVATAIATPIGPYPTSAVALAEAADGTVVAAGTETSPVDQSGSSAVVRYTHDGALDTRFGAGGIVQLGADTRVFALVLQPDGKIVVAGDTSVDGARGLFVARLLP